MKKGFSILLYLSLTLIIFSSCKDKIDKAPSQKQFVWEALNYWYFWQADVPKLVDNKAFFKNDQAYHDYLIGFQDAEGVFEDLLFYSGKFW
ncbi:MAG: hypothetical protein U5K72_15420 [Balneolaceae bacterium]|nr:hypothetical protein [Balneolaceae bacterium]